MEYCIKSSCRLSRIDILATALEVTAKWAQQIRESLKALHSIGLSWDDVKPSKIPIDGRLEVWLTDFTGKFTDVSADANLSGTMDKDSEESFAS